MRGACRNIVPVDVLLLALVVACGNDRGTGAVPAGDSVQTSAPTTGAIPDTSGAVRDTAITGALRDTTATRISDSASARAKPAADVAQKPSPRKPAAPRKPAVEAPTPATPAPAAPAPASETPLETPSAGATPAQAQADAPLRDQYHQAPLDTVTQDVYDGWKQFNLNCARCHGEDVLGTTIAPHLIVSLKPNGPVNTKELFVQIVCAGRPEKGMPAWCPLGMEMEKIQAIYAYVKGRSEGTIRPGRPALKPEG